MNVTSRTRRLLAASLLVLGFAAGNSQAQSIIVNNNPCADATVQFGQGSIKIDTTKCGAVSTAPTLTGVSPTGGLPGTPVTINGANLSGASVTIGGLAATISSNNGSTITTNVPVSATAGSVGGVAVTVPGYAALSLAFSVFSPPAQPTVSSVLPISGPAGTALTINGSNLSGASVTVGGIAAVIASNNGTVISTSVPATATAASVGGVVVTVTGFSPVTSAFTVTAALPPVISTVSPNSGPVGTPITISGSGFIGATVTIGGAAVSVTTSSAAQILATVPSLPAGQVNIVVTTNAGTNSSPFTVTEAVAATGCDVTIEGVQLPCKTKSPPGVAFAAPHGGLNGAGQEMNAYAMPPSRCSTSPALTRSWQHNIDVSEYKATPTLDYFVLNANEALSFRFTVPITPTTGSFQYGEAAASGGNYAPAFMSITSAPCDFNVSKIAGDARDSCYKTNSAGVGVLWSTFTSPPAHPAFCRLVPGRTYYMNIRFQDARPSAEGGTPTQDSCSFGVCGGILQTI